MTVRPITRVWLALVTAVALTACGDDQEAGAPEETAQTVSLVGQDNLTWDADELTADAGTITMRLICEDGVNHNIVVEQTDEVVAECAPGETVEGTVDLDPGEYEYVCTVPGHASTMRGTLTVN